MSVVSRNPFDLLGDDGEQSSSPVAAKTPAPAAAAKKDAAPARNVPGSGNNNNAAREGGAAGGRGGASRGGRYPSRGGPRNVFRGEGGDKGPRNTGPDPASGTPEGQEGPGGFEKERVAPPKRAHHGPDKHTKGPRGEGRQLTEGGHKARGGGGARGAKTPAFGGERRQFERKSGTLPDSQKKVDQGWGADEGEAELTAEVEGEKDAQAEETAPGTPAEAADESAPKGTGFEDAAENKEAAAPEEPEEVQKSYDQFLAEKAEQAFAFGKKEARTVNDETVEGKAFVREGIDDFFSGKQEKTSAAKTKAKKEKVFIEVDGQFAQPAGSRPPREDRPERGGRGGRGGRGRGEGRGGARGRGAPRGGFASRNNNAGANIDASNEKAFPALGA